MTVNGLASFVAIFDSAMALALLGLTTTIFTPHCRPGYRFVHSSTLASLKFADRRMKERIAS